jgi:O-succinylbenzoic acid--CoA ligase
VSGDTGGARLVDPLIAAARSHPDRLAVVDDQARWSFAQLDAAAGAIARGLAAAGLGPLGRVALLAGETARTVAAIHAIRRSGAVLVPLNRRAAAVELAAQLDDAAIGLLVHDGATAELAAMAGDRATGGVRLLAIDELLSSPPLPAPSATGRSAGQATGEATDQATDPTGFQPEAPATLVFTSGTTGRPKAAILTHVAHAASAAAWAAFLQPAPTDRWLACLPFHHVAGLGMIDRAARWGAPLVVHPRFDPAAVDAAIDGDAISHCSLVGSMLGRLLEARAGRPAPASLRAILLGGERTPPELVRAAALSGLRVVPTYGLTETASGVVALPAEEAAAHPDAAGRPLPGVDLRIRLGGRTASPAEVGEIEVRGPMLFAGYLARPGETGAALDDGWFRTGDLGSLDGAGRLVVADRRGDLIVSGGENVYPAEVEAVLLAHPGVIDAAVVGRPDPRWGAVPVAAIVERPGVAPTDADLDAHCRASLAGYKIPVVFERVGALPRSPGGKLLRREIRVRAGTEAAR